MNRHTSILNYRMIARVLGLLLFVESLFFAFCSLVSLYYHGTDYIYFLYSILINISAGSVLLILSRKAKTKVTRRDGFLVVSLSWMFFSIFGMMPYYLGGYIPNITDAFFETVSGFTTTGATILNNIEAMPHGILFWRSLTQWIGGLGIVIFTIAVLPIFSGGTLQFFSAEYSGIVHNRIHPKISSTANRLWLIYIMLTLMEAVLLYWGGMGLFDSVCHSLTTTSTGGYSTKQDSIAYWNSSYIEYVVIVFMILSSVNYSLYFFSLRGRFNKFINDTELKYFLGIVFGITAIVMVSIYVTMDYDIEKSFRTALFQVSSIQSSCGFITDDYNLWPQNTWLLLILAMIIGGCGGSSSGGVKVYRIAVIYKNIRNEFKRLIHPVAVLPVRMNKDVLSSNAVSGMKTFFMFYLVVVIVGWFSLICVGIDFTESLGLAVSCIGNTGPALGSYGSVNTWSVLPEAAKWITSFLMLIGRLELFSVLLLLYPGFWSKQ